MKRTLCMLLALVMLLACSAMSTAVADDLPEAEVKMWVIGPGEQADADVVKERLNQILNEQVPNTKLTLSLIDGNGYEDMLSKALAASERIDIAWTGWMHNLTNMAFEGSLLPLNDLVTNYGQDIAAFLGEEGIKLHQLADGELYQIISWQGLMGNRQGLYLPTELVNEMPEGWQDELQAAYYAIANGDHSDAAYQKLVDTFEIYPKTLQEKGKLMRGLYIDALTRPLSFSERSDEKLHYELLRMADEPGGRTRLHRMLEEIDPDSAMRLHENDVRRVARAIEIYRLTGVTQTEQARLDAQREGDYDEQVFALEWPREMLYERISRRVDAMLAAGLIDEVRRLKRDSARYPTAAQAIGYKEIAAALDGRMDMDEAVERVKQATRNYAKRQLTWLRRDGRTQWISAENRTPAEIAEEIRERCGIE